MHKGHAHRKAKFTNQMFILLDWALVLLPKEARRTFPAGMSHIPGMRSIPSDDKPSLGSEFALWPLLGIN